MPQVSLTEAAAKIYQIVCQRKTRASKSPFFVITGAGVSYPPIPLAGMIERECRAIAQQYGSASDVVFKNPMDSYSHWFNSAFPSSEEMQEYLRKKIEKAPISKANLRLAHLILDGTVARTVFTTNFDDMLTKALELFGERPLVCDHPLTANRMRIESRDIQIIHVHGSCWFYDCCNLKHDIADRAGHSPMSVILDQSLRDHSPLVIGYSGWSGDIVMTSLEKRLKAGRLANPLFWFCFKREDALELPEWLREHNDVCLVVPSEDALKPEDLPTSRDADGSVRRREREMVATQPADKVFDSLVKTFNLLSPPLTEDPLTFYAAQLKSLIGATDTTDSELEKYYSFQTVIGRIERASSLERVSVPDPMAPFRKAMREADYLSAIRIARGVDVELLSKIDRQELFNALVEAASENIGSPNEEIEAFDQAIKLGDELERDYANDARFKEQRVRAYLNKAILLEGDGHLEQAFPCFVTAEELSSNGTSEELQTIHSRALMGLARSYDHLDKPIEEISTYELLVSRFKDSPIQSIKRRVVNAMFNRALTLESVGRDVEVIPAYNAVLEYIGTDHDENFQRVWCQSMLNKIIKLQTTGKREEALPLADEVIDRYSSSRVVDVLEQVARVMLVKGYNLHQLGRIDDALATFETLSSRFAEVPSDDIQERVKLANESIGKIRDVPKTDELGD